MNLKKITIRDFQLYNLSVGNCNTKYNEKDAQHFILQVYELR